MKTVSILQPSYLPWLGYFDQIARSDVFVFYDDVPFDKHGWRHRNRVKAVTGPVWLSVPVKHAGRMGQLIAEAEIDYQRDWAAKHINTLMQSYARAPYRDFYLPKLVSLLCLKWTYLLELNLALSKYLVECLGLNTVLLRSSELGQSGGRSERLLAICQQLGATKYLSGSAARDYLDVELFARNGIEVVWQDYRHPVYAQQHGPFVPYLSVVDVLLNKGGESLSVIRSGGEVTTV